MRFFEVYELVDRQTYELLGSNAIKLFDKGLLEDLDKLRETLGKITVNNWYWNGGLSNRGYRTNNSNVGSKSSQHREGKAIDFDVAGMTASEVRKHILNNKFLYPNIMRMEDDVSWVHIDTKEPRRTIHLFKP